MWRWVKRDRIRLRAQYPVAYARYKTERQEVHELSFNPREGNQAFRAQNRDVRDECSIEWGTTGALEFKPDLPSNPAYWEGPNKEGKPSKEARANQEGGCAPKVSHAVAPETSSVHQACQTSHSERGHAGWGQARSPRHRAVPSLAVDAVASAGATTWQGSRRRSGTVRNAALSGGAASSHTGRSRHVDLPPRLARSASTTSGPPRSVTGTEGDWFQILKLKNGYKAVHVGHCLEHCDHGRDE